MRYGHSAKCYRRALKTRGMTLLEVLVALAIFATAAISVIRSVSQHIHTLSLLEEKTFAEMVVDNQMANVYLTSTTTVHAQHGKERLANRDWYWSVKPVATSQALLQAFDVSVATALDKGPIVTVRSYLARKQTQQALQ